MSLKSDFISKYVFNELEWYQFKFKYSKIKFFKSINNYCHKLNKIFIDINTNYCNQIKYNRINDTCKICLLKNNILISCPRCKNTFHESCIYNWTPANSLSDPTIANPLAQPNTTTEYLIELEKLGCTEILPITVQVRDDLPCSEPYIFIPNAFTPNGDGENDYFKVRSEIIIDLNMKIYNRWGELVFESNDINLGWDGRFRGVLQEQEVYVYVVEARFIDNSRQVLRGNLTLIR